MPQPLEADVHHPLVVVEQRRAALGAHLVGLERHPIDAVLGEQVAPFLEAPLVEQLHLVDEEFLDRAQVAERLGGR